MRAPKSDASSVGFPAGPTYPELLGSDAGVAWVRYKVWAGDWYLETLTNLIHELGDPGRHVGVEMAIDGALSSLSGAFDAAVGLLIEAAEQANQVPEESRTPVRDYRWATAKKVLSSMPGEYHETVQSLTEDVDAALAGARDEHPTGWLAVLRRFRNHAIHQDTLARTWADDGSRHTVVGMSDIPGSDVTKYLAASCDQVSDLTERVLGVANLVGVVGVHTPLCRSRWDA